MGPFEKAVSHTHTHTHTHNVTPSEEAKNVKKKVRDNVLREKLKNTDQINVTRIPHLISNLYAI